MSAREAQCALIGATLLAAVAEHLHREPDTELAAALAKHWTPSGHEIARAANACELPPTLAHLRAEHCSPYRDPGSGLSEEEFDAIVAAARRETAAR